MRILIIGGGGTIGARIVEHYQNTHQVIIAGRTSGDYTVDIASASSIERLFTEVEIVDAIICAAGEARWASFAELTEEDYYIGIGSKLMGQVNVARIGQKYLADGGSITLSTGILADDPVLNTSSAAMVNGGIHSFVQAASLELSRGLRLNAVSLGVVEDAYEKYKDFFPGHNPIPTTKVVHAYVRSVEGRDNGKIIRVYE